ncbi:hypothetical protein BD408DRAFT_420353 [Parasitella parasitica]|nr:hypothetical protein BD408DRAFT_420353 [Parasitella parasitica]
MLVWIHRILQFPEEQPYVWSLCFICLLSLLTLPWFRAEFIPSGKDKNEGIGWFYLWGLLFGQHQWIPLDTWMFAIFQLTFNVGIFILYFIWKSSSAFQLKCKGTGQAPSQLVCDRIWFQVLVLIYWVWRFQGLSDLAAFYGGVYPTLVLNLLIWWLIGVVAVVLIGKNGLYNSIKNYHKQQQAEPVGVPLEICPSCIDAVGGGEDPTDSFFVTTAGQDEEQHTNTQEESRGILFDADGSDSSSSTFNSTNRAFRRNATNKKD